MSLRARSWHATNTFTHTEFPPERLAAQRELSVSVCLPARDEARTIGAILEVLLGLRERGVIDQVVVVDNSTDVNGRNRPRGWEPRFMTRSICSRNWDRCWARVTRCGARWAC